MTDTVGIGSSPPRADGTAKAAGAFDYAGDLRAEGMVWAATVRSPYPHARILGIDTARARQLPGVRDVITHADIPGRPLFGQMKVDQPVLAVDTVRYHGEPVAVVAADNPELAAAAAALVQVRYLQLPALTDPVAAIEPGAALIHPDGNVVAHTRIRRGSAQQDHTPPAAIVVRGEYTVGMQDQAFLATEAGLAEPDGHGGVTLHVATQWAHLDQSQLAASLGVPADRVTVRPAGVGGAFGGREDLTLHVPACLLALRLGRPVKMCYSRSESFLGHVHRHPAVMSYEHGCDADGRLIYVKARIVLDGGAYASSSPAIAGNAATHAVGPYQVPNVWADAYAAYTNNPPCGAMRGFGTVQPCFGYESQMDRLAAAVGIDPVEIRLRNAACQGAQLPTGQVLDSPAPVAELVTRLHRLPLPEPRAVPPTAVVRGVGYAACLKNSMFSEGFDDCSTARVSLRISAGQPVAVVTSAAAEVGQGVHSVQSQIVQTELGIRPVGVVEADSRFPSAGPSSASRQTYVTGGAVRQACLAVRAEIFELTRCRIAGSEPARLADGLVLDHAGNRLVSLVELLDNRTVEHTAEFHHRRTEALDPVHGQGDSAVQFGFAAHRAVVDVDTELGTVTVVEMAIAQDVGRAINPQAVVGQLQGGTAQGIGLALFEELQLREGVVQNPAFGEYLLPTMLDVPAIRVELLELVDPQAPYGVRGIGELPAISSPAAVAAAVRAATGRAISRIPIRPQDLID